MPTQVVKAASGDAEVTQIVQTRNDDVTIGVNPVDSSGTVTITVMASGEDTYKTLTDGTIDLSAPQTIQFSAPLKKVKATSSSLDYDLVVTTR